MNPEKIEDLKRRIVNQTAVLVKVLGPTEALAVLFPAVMAVLTVSGGDQLAATFLREYADRLDHGETTPPDLGGMLN